MLVDLGRNDLGRVSPTRDRAGSRSTWKWSANSHVLHLVSHVEGRLAPGLDAPRRVAQRLPAGTLSGAPKVRAMQLIAAAERERRGLYGGGRGVPRLRRQPRHGDRHPERRAQGRCRPISMPVPGSSRGASRRREFEETEHKGSGAASRPGAGGRRRTGDRQHPARTGSRRRPIRPPLPIRRHLRPRRNAARGGELRGDPRESTTTTASPTTSVQALQAAGAAVRVVRNDAIDLAGLAAAGRRSGRRAAGDRDLAGPVGPGARPASPIAAVTFAPSAASRSWASAWACSRCRRGSGRRSCGRRRSSTARPPRSSTTASACSRACPRRFLRPLPLARRGSPDAAAGAVRDRPERRGRPS